MVVNWFDDPKESKITAADMISDRKAAAIGASQSEHQLKVQSSLHKNEPS